MTNMAALGQTLIALLAMIFLILALAYGLKKLQHLQRPQGKKTLKIVDHLSLGVKEKIVLVSVGDRQLLLGVTPNSIQRLESFDEPVVTVSTDVQTSPSDSAVAPISGPLATKFAEVFRQHRSQQGRKVASPSQVVSNRRPNKDDH